MILAAACVALPGCRPDCRPAHGDARPNVILVTVDTLRSDYLHAYGHPTVRTPSLDALAAEGAIFPRSYSQTNVTVPSHMSIMSSQPLARHGAISNTRLAQPTDAVLPAVFARAGYQTAAFVSAQHLGRLGPLGHVLGPAFPVYRVTQTSSQPLRGDKTTDRFGRWLRGACRAPVFAWIHYWDPHMPYAPPEPYASMYYHGDPRAPTHTSLVDVPFGWELYDLQALHRVLHAHAREVRTLHVRHGLSTGAIQSLVQEPPLPNADGDPGLWDALVALAAEVRRELPLHPQLAAWLAGVRDLDFARARYAGEVSFIDAQVGAVVELVRRLGLSEQTIVVVTADHGESLGEHAIYFNHHVGLYEPNVRVPLIVWAPGRVVPGARATLARGLDVAPTVLHLAGLPVPPAMEGRDLFGPEPDDAAAFLESERRWQLAVVEGNWKLIRTLVPFSYASTIAHPTGVELFDLARDPEERVDVAPREPAVVARLGARLDGWNATVMVGAPPSPPVVDRAQRDRLRALGYIE